MLEKQLKISNQELHKRIECFEKLFFLLKLENNRYFFLSLASDQSPLFIRTRGDLNMIKPSLIGQKIAAKISEIADTKISNKS